SSILSSRISSVPSVLYLVAFAISFKRSTRSQKLSGNFFLVFAIKNHLKQIVDCLLAIRACGRIGTSITMSFVACNVETPFKLASKIRSGLHNSRARRRIKHKFNLESNVVLYSFVLLDILTSSEIVIPRRA